MTCLSPTENAYGAYAYAYGDAYDAYGSAN